MTGIDFSPETFDLELKRAKELFGENHRAAGLHALFDSKTGNAMLFYPVAPIHVFDLSGHREPEPFPATAVTEVAQKVFGSKVAVDLCTDCFRPANGAPAADTRVTEYCTGSYELCHVVPDAAALSVEERTLIVDKFVSLADRVRDRLEEQIQILENGRDHDAPDV
jgi:hypothetical protein